MNFNQTRFKPELNNRLERKLKTLHHWQQHTLEFLIEYLLASNEQQQLAHCESFLHLLAKIRFNLESAVVLLPLMSGDYRFKTSVNVLYRSVIDDIINAYYLFGVVNLADRQQVALANELNILHKEYIQSMIKGVNADFAFERFVDELKEQAASTLPDVEKDFKDANPELVDMNGAWKKNAEIRASSNQFFIDKLNQGKNNSFISESKKLEFLKARGITTYHNIEAIFKYLSQYQHYSPKMHDFLNTHIEFDLAIYQRCLGELLMLLDQLLQFIELKDKAAIKSYWDQLAPNVFNSFSDEQGDGEI
jgi:hypothetical protein